MPIKNLTDRPAQFPRIGILRKGSPKQGGRYGKDLEGFRFDTDDAQALAAFEQAYGDEPRQVNIFLPYNTADENFQTWKEAWTASALQHRCDGETCTVWLDKQTNKYRKDSKPCPGGCKEVGRLLVIIPELRRMAYVQVETHSINDIIEIQQNLLALEQSRGTLRGIPIVLSRRPREISTPRDNGQRARVTKWLLHVEAAPRWVDLQLAAEERAALPASPALRALPAASFNASTGEILDREGRERALENVAVDMNDYEARGVEQVVEDEAVLKQLSALLKIVRAESRRLGVPIIKLAAQPTVDELRQTLELQEAANREHLANQTTAEPALVGAADDLL